MPAPSATNGKNKKPRRYTLPPGAKEDDDSEDSDEATGDDERSTDDGKPTKSFGAWMDSPEWD